MLSWGGGKPLPLPRPHSLHKTTDLDGKTNPGGLLHNSLQIQSAILPQYIFRTDAQTDAQTDKSFRRQVCKKNAYAILY